MGQIFDRNRQQVAQGLVLPEYQKAVMSMLAQGPNCWTTINWEGKARPEGVPFYLALQADCGTDVAGYFKSLIQGKRIELRQTIYRIPDKKEYTLGTKWDAISERSSEPLPILLHGRTDNFEPLTIFGKAVVSNVSHYQIEHIQTKLPIYARGAKSWALGYLKVVEDAKELGISIPENSHGNGFVKLLRTILDEANQIKNLPDFDPIRGDLDRQDLKVFNELSKFTPYLD